MGSLENDLGTTYAEIDLTNQRMWMYKDGKVVVATDVVTGKPDGEHDTPQGTYKLKYKEKNATLKGANYSVVNMPVVCYYHAKTDNPNTSTETTTQSTTKAS